MAEDAVARLRSDLTAADYTVESVEALWGPEAAGALHRNQIAPAVRALEGVETPLAALAALFMLNATLPAEQVEAALPSLGLDAALTLGLLAREGSTIRAARDLRPYAFTDRHGPEHWWICSDLSELALGHALPTDHVLGIGGATMTLSRLVIDDPVGSVLDLGTGCGIQAMHARRHADRVVATDVSERALQIARFNAELNQLDAIEFRRGDLFEPVAGETFDQIISNPPFVITPRREGVRPYEYRDGGLVGDALVEKLVREVGAHLTEGGLAQFLANWEYRPDGLERLRRWVAESSLDAWAVEREVQSPTQYAETWIRDGGTRPGTAEFDRLWRTWVDDFAERGVTAVGFGYVLLRSPAGRPTLERFERLTTALPSGAGGLGTHVGDCLAAHDAQDALDAHQFARLRLTVAPDVTEERHYWPGAANPSVITLVQGGGFARRVEADPLLAGFVGACDGQLSVGALCAALAELFDADEASVTAQLTAQARELLVTGLLRIGEAH